ncbi:MAG TPA: flagellar FliJ family protein, partial [Oligoflexia bacterium]|nr:flagellar FliJ family protein [Oligoflexia bacterium]
LTNKKRQEYVAARQKREALEKLKTKRHQNYLEDVKAHEQRMLDDLYIMRASFLNREKRDAE